MSDGGVFDADCGFDQASMAPVCALEWWAGSGAMALGGRVEDRPGVPPARFVRRFLDMIALLPVPIDAAALLAARAAEMGTTPAGQTSANASARLLQAGDGWFVVNLARESDRELIPAVIEADADGAALADPFETIGTWASARPANQVCDRLQLLGVPAAVLGSDHGPAVTASMLGPPRETPSCTARPTKAALLRVLDLSALWAGPLAAHLLARIGARVTTVEDVNRPDGARWGPPLFYRDLHQHRHHIELNLQSAGGRADLACLAADCDVIIEASRPHALARLGLMVHDWLEARPGRSWLSITGYGRQAHEGRWVAFGDDAAVAGGVVCHDGDGNPMFCGDAIADPLTGVRGAFEVLASQRSGGGHLIDVSMAGVCAELAAGSDHPGFGHELSFHAGRWWMRHEGRERVAVAPARTAPICIRDCAAQ